MVIKFLYALALLCVNPSGNQPDTMCPHIDIIGKHQAHGTRCELDTFMNSLQVTNCSNVGAVSKMIIGSGKNIDGTTFEIIEVFAVDKAKKHSVERYFFFTIVNN